MVDGPLEEYGALWHGMIGVSVSSLMLAAALRDVLVPLVRRDPFCLLRTDSRHPWPADGENA